MAVTSKLCERINYGRTFERRTVMPDTIKLSTKARKLVALCASEGFKSLDELLQSSMIGNVSPAICMHEDCDHLERMEKDLEEGWCDKCQSNTMVSGLVLAEINQATAGPTGSSF
jgi:hypothetical protein